MLDFKDWSDKDVLEEAHNVASRLSYYNAAEGNWRQEAAARGECQKEYREVMKEVYARGLEFENRGYLL
jgi:hypothetical protein